MTQKKSGFASKLNLKMKAIQPDIEPLSRMTITNVKIEDIFQPTKRSYATLSGKGIDGLHSGGKDFHVGATKILHFINPELFPIVDSNAAKTLWVLFELPYKNSTHPGYSGLSYTESMATIQNVILNYGADRFRDLEPDTPIMRIFDKLTFAYGNGW
ncbi:MAG: hypothetical protein ACTSRW_15425 [Candidatus Helarchaeota archaeon]